MAGNRDEAIRRARAERGVTESPPNSNRTKFGEWYGFNGVAWCAIFLSWVLAHAGAGEHYRSAAVVQSLARAKREGRLTNDPRPGDVACKMYNATQGHTGLVVGVDGGYIVTVEGNTSAGNPRDGGWVKEVRRAKSWWNRGFIRIPYDDTPPVRPPDPPVPPVQPPRPPHGGPGLKVDGDFGPATIRALQQRLAASGARIAVDGQFGPQTIRGLQGYLNHVQGPVKIDGQLGPQTIRAMQNRCGTRADGSWGPNTTRALQDALNHGRF